MKGGEGTMQLYKKTKQKTHLVSDVPPDPFQLLELTENNSFPQYPGHNKIKPKKTKKQHQNKQKIPTKKRQIQSSNIF